MDKLFVAVMIVQSLWMHQISCLQNKVYSRNNRIDIRDHIDEIDQTSNQRNDLIKDSSNVPHSRQKRLLWITNDGRLALPPGTSLVISPTLSLPFVRHPPDGFFSNISISMPLTIDFDSLGLTDNENPYGELPPLLARSFGHSIGKMVADFVGKHVAMRRGKRGIEQLPKEIQERAMKVLHGGERALLFGAVEDLLSNFGIDGKPCLLRAICEVHAHPLTNFGLLGEMMKLFLSASKSPYSHLLEEYVEAEKAGSGGDDGPGECWPYFKDCPKSLFVPKKNKYTEDAESHHHDAVFSNERQENLNPNDIEALHE